MAPEHKFTMTCLILGKLCGFLLLHASACDLAPIRRHLQKDPLTWNQRIVDVEEHPEGLLLHFDLPIYKRTEKQNPLQLPFKDVRRAVRLLRRALDTLRPDNQSYRSAHGKIFANVKTQLSDGRFYFAR